MPIVPFILLNFALTSAHGVAAAAPGPAASTFGTLIQVSRVEGEKRSTLYDSAVRQILTSAEAHQLSQFKGDYQDSLETWNATVSLPQAAMCRLNDKSERNEYVYTCTFWSDNLPGLNQIVKDLVQSVLNAGGQLRARQAMDTVYLFDTPNNKSVVSIDAAADTGRPTAIFRVEEK